MATLANIDSYRRLLHLVLKHCRIARLRRGQQDLFCRPSHSTFDQADNDNDHDGGNT